MTFKVRMLRGVYRLYRMGLILSCFRQNGTLECQSARMSKITNDGLTRSDTGCFYSCTHMATVDVKVDQTDLYGILRYQWRLPSQRERVWRHVDDVGFVPDRSRFHFALHLLNFRLLFRLQLCAIIHVASWQYDTILRQIFLAWSLIPSVVFDKTRKPSYRWQTRATRKRAKNCSNSTCLQRCRWQYWPIFIRLAVVESEICEIPRNSLKIQTYGV